MKILVTGGAGFIGSNLVEALLTDVRVEKVRVLDDLSNGYIENIEFFFNHPKFEFIQGDICDFETCLKATEGIDRISHQAALGSVPRSIENPLRSTHVNILGTVNILYAAVQNKSNRVILACSSSTYGDSAELPKIESRIGNPMSPYAITKYSIEQFGFVFKKTYGLDFIGLRYFNIFGPKQSPANPYAAVIPLFCYAFLKGDRPPKINGDGLNSRDFTYVSNAVQANMLGLFIEEQKPLNEIYNIACGEEVSLNQMIEILNNISGKNIKATYLAPRVGDVRHSKADISKAQALLGYSPSVKFEEGLKLVFDWYKEQKF